MIIRPSPDLSAPPPESRPRTIPRLRPAQAAPVRRTVELPADRNPHPGDRGGITPSALKGVLGMPFAD